MFFQSDYNDLMPSAPESDAPPTEKTGPARFMEIIGTHGGTLLAVNLLFIAGCIPVVTMPLSLFAMNRVVRRVVQSPRQPRRRSGTSRETADKWAICPCGAGRSPASAIP